ncbi:MAG: trigger factor [Anaerolineae bacterium]|nr:MAG: trigger factor [Anaerolineae bacterium]
MTLTIKTEEDEQRQLKVTVEVPEEEVQQEMRRTARKLSRQLRIPGFRKGKVPYNIMAHRIGEESLRAEAVESMLEGVVEEALEEVEAPAYRQPTLDNIDMDPLVLDITIPLQPKVSLGDYRSIRREIESVAVTDAALEEALHQIRINHQILEEVERPVEEGDLVTLSGEGKIDEEDGQIIWNENEIELPMDPDRTFPNVPFVENVIGLKVDEDKEFSVSFNDDYEDEELAGKPATFRVKVLKVQSRELPELTDELAQEDGEYESVDDLRLALKKELFERAERDARARTLDEFTTELVEGAEILYPPAAIESELDGLLEETKERVTRSGWQWNDYLQLHGESEETLREAWRENATKRIERGLALGEFVSEERLTVKSQEIDEAIEQRVENFKAKDEFQEELRKMFSQGQGLDLVSNELLMEKTIDRVEEILTGTAPDLETLRAEDSASLDEEE